MDKICLTKQRLTNNIVFTDICIHQCHYNKNDLLTYFTKELILMINLKKLQNKCSHFVYIHDQVLSFSIPLSLSAIMPF